jgi:hypothetical protein
MIGNLGKSKKINIFLSMLLEVLPFAVSSNRGRDDPILS